MAESVPMLHTTDIESLHEFYRSLGFEEESAWKPNGELRWCNLVYDSAAIMLQKSERVLTDRSLPDIHLFFVVGDVDSIYTKWKSEGIDVSIPRDEFYGWRQMFVRDPDGRYVCFECDLNKR